jgi:TPR repeat protein
MDGTEDITSGAKAKSIAAAGAIAGAVPFIISTVSVSTVNGHITRYRDNVAIGGGGIALALGAVATVIAVRSKSRGAIIGGAVAVLALGGYQLAKGFGAFESGAGATSSSSMDISMPTIPTTPPEPKVDPNDPATCADAHSCFQIGEKLGDTDPKRSLVAYTRACDFKSPSGCYNAGIDWGEDSAPTKDLAKAIGFFQRACDLEDAPGCANLGVYYLHGEGVAKDEAKGLELTKRACELHGANGCKNLAAIYREGIGVPANPAKALEIGIQACDLDQSKEAAAACNATGAMLASKKKMSKHDGEQARQLFEKACDRSAEHCYNLGVSYEQGFGGTKKDLVKARGLYQKGCDAGNLEACDNLGVFFDNGLGGPKDRAAAKSLFDKACKGGVDNACKNLDVNVKKKK